MAITNPTIDFSKISFEELKTELITYIRNVSEFNSVNIAGANFNLYVNLLAYVTNILSYNYNQGLNELYLPSVTLRENILKIIKLLNYTPNRATSAKIRVDLSGFTKEGSSPALLKYDKIASAGFNFYYLGEAIDVTSETSLNDVQFSEGVLNVNESAYIAIGNTDFEKFEIKEQNIGTHLVIFSIDGIGNRTYFSEYEKGKLYVSPETQNIYFVEETNSGYEIKFGNNKLGRHLTTSETIGYEFLVPDTTGDSNTLTTFTWNGGGINELVNSDLTDYISNVSTITLNDANDSSTGADTKETIEEIKLNASRFYQSQGRATNEDDYLAMILKHPDVGIAQVLGGEKLDPLQLGKVFITVKPDLNAHPAKIFTDGELQSLKEYLDDLNVVTIEPIMQNPVLIELIINTKVRYSVSGRTPSYGNISSAIKEFVNTDNSNFGEYFEYSQLTKVIDASDEIITSNITNIEKFILMDENNLRNNTEDGSYIITAAKNIDNTFETKIVVYDDSTGSPTTYEQGTDYEIDFYDTTSGRVYIDWLNTGYLGLTQTGAFETRFYFDVVDNDIFLNQGQIFNIEDDNINITVEKV